MTTKLCFLGLVVAFFGTGAQGDCDGLEMKATCDNAMKVYFDGELQSAPSSELGNWPIASTFCVPTGTKVIGIECKDYGVVAGTLASFSDGTVTDASWQCSNTPSDDWTLPAFQGTWADAYVITSNVNAPYWSTIQAISTDAKWIWTPGWQGADRNVYCRKVIDTTPGPHECSKCSYEGDFGYLSDPNPCKYNLCRRTSGKDGYTYTMTEMPCPPGTMWNQAILNCGHDTTGTCIPGPRPTQPPVTECHLEEVWGDETKFRDIATGTVQSCAPGTVFDKDECVCIHGNNPDTCDKSLLYFPFDDDLNSKGCEQAVANSAPNDQQSVQLAWDAKKGKSAQFNGKNLLLVPFLKNYFADNNVQKFTLSLWFKWTGDASQIGGLVTNSNCEGVDSFDIHVGAGSVVSGSMGTDGSATRTSGAFTVPRYDWVHVAEVYDGSILKFYVNGRVKSSKNLSGPITNTHCSMAIGQKGPEGEGFFQGFIDELKVFREALNAGRIRALYEE